MSIDPCSLIRARAIAHARASMAQRHQMMVAHDKRIRAAKDVDQDANFLAREAEFRRRRAIDDQVHWARKEGMPDAEAEQYRRDMLARKVDPYASRPDPKAR